jgi:hypothetical protein
MLVELVEHQLTPLKGKVVVGVQQGPAVQDKMVLLTQT